MPVAQPSIKRTLDPELISAKQMPHLAMRYAETWHKARLFAYEDKAAREVYALYKQAFADIRQTARETADNLGITKVVQDSDGVQWKRAVVDKVRPLLTRLGEALALHGLEYSVRAYYAGYYARMWQMDVATRPEVNIHAPILNLSQVTGNVASTLRESARLYEQEIPADAYRQLIRSLLGREWRARYAVQLDRLIADIEINISSGMSAGEGIDDIMRRVRETMGVQTDRRIGPRGGARDRLRRANYNRIEALTRTVVNKASNDGAVTAYRENRDILGGYQWLTARDERVCRDCQGYNMVTFKLDDYFRPPLHPRCRCTVIPVIADRLLIIPDEAPRSSFADFITSAGLGVMADNLLSDFMGF
jgi:SPP1 gp7 family putative phage head morphogenesis protein